MSFSPRVPRSPTLGAPPRRSGLQSRSTQLLVLRFGWVVLVIWFEIGDFFASLSTCHFPDSQLRRRMPGGRKQAVVTPTHLVLLADPHVPHPRLSYPPDSRPLANWLKQRFDELFMRKSWNVVTRLGRIDGVIVVGDMLDWGRGVMSDAEYEDYHALFRSIFQLPPSVPMYFVPGNHDIPLGPNRLFSPHARERYAQHFSPPNAILPVANHSLILLDAIGLVEEDYRRYAAEMQFGEWDGVEGGVIEFVKALGDDPPPAPRILISHIPLARAEAASCGPLREHGRIQKGAGPGYQNLLGSETSRFLLEVLKPSLVFSGDDHDYCELYHPAGVKEVTLKSFSSSAGIRRPGFQLLSLVPPAPAPAGAESYPPQTTHADVPCFLPDQLGVYTRVYSPLALLTFAYLFATNVRAAWNRSSASLWDAKSRVSPNLVAAEQMPPMASVRERPVPLTLPSRKSAQHLAGLGMSVPTPRRANSVQAPGLGPQPTLLPSTPASPTTSPRPSFHNEPGPFAYPYPSDDLELGESQAVSASAAYAGGTSPNLSRRSSYAVMPDYLAPADAAGPGASYLLPLPGSSGGGTGLGLSAPAGGSMRRSLSSASVAVGGGGGGGLGAAPGMLHPNARRVTMPRLLSAHGWQVAARAKDRSVLGLVAERQGWSANLSPAGARAVLRWAWRARNGVVGKSWREALAVAWPAAVVWVLVNALFFIG
ncbi:hypothetical protein Q5752_004126 [Cryptotrichosporon argae]